MKSKEATHLKVKIFTGYNADDFGHLEKEANVWLEDHPNIEVESRVVKVTPESNRMNNGSLCCTIVIFYR